MAPTIKDSVWSLISATPAHINPDNLGSADGPLAEADTINSRVTLARRDDSSSPEPGNGVIDPHDISNVGFFILFALIGVAFVCTGIWFFFFAKNGGFYFKEGDWEDYKSTVLRRKGPNGTLLSGATKSTNLGGGSVYRDVADNDNDTHDDGRTVVTESTALSGITAGPSDIGAREKRRKKQEMRERDRERRRKERAAGEEQQQQHSSRRNKGRHVGEAGVEDEDAERAAKEELRNYRHEKPARVGGLNKESEGSTWDGSTNPTASTASSDLLSNRQSTPTNSPAKAGIRKVYSTADRIEAERVRKDARRRREELQQRVEKTTAPTSASSPGSPSRTARRDFSFQRSVVGSESALTESLLEGGSSAAGTSDLGTKSYHHPRPELRAQRQRERVEWRGWRGGYRRGKGEDDDEL